MDHIPTLLSSFTRQLQSPPLSGLLSSFLMANTPSREIMESTCLDAITAHQTRTFLPLYLLMSQTLLTLGYNEMSFIAKFLHQESSRSRLIMAAFWNFVRSALPTMLLVLRVEVGPASNGSSSELEIRLPFEAPMANNGFPDAPTAGTWPRDFMDSQPSLTKPTTMLLNPSGLRLIWAAENGPSSLMRDSISQDVTTALLLLSMSCLHSHSQLRRQIPWGTLDLFLRQMIVLSFILNALMTLYFLSCKVNVFSMRLWLPTPIFCPFTFCQYVPFIE